MVFVKCLKDLRVLKGELSGAYKKWVINVVLLCQKEKKRHFWLVPLFVNFCVLENISKVKFLRAGLENSDFATFAITLFHYGVLAFFKLHFVNIVDLGVFFCPFRMSHQLTYFFPSVEQYCPWALLLSHNKPGKQPAGPWHKVVYWSENSAVLTSP